MSDAAPFANSATGSVRVGVLLAQREGRADAGAVAERDPAVVLVGTSAPPTLNPRVIELAVHVPLVAENTHGSVHGAVCRKTGQVHTLALAGEPHLILTAPPPWSTTSA